MQLPKIVTSLLNLNHVAPRLMIALLLSGFCNFTSQAQTAENRFEKNVQAYETADKNAPPPKGAILLVGDSQFYRWKTLAEDLPDFTLINRGVDSFQISCVFRSKMSSDFGGR